MQPTAPATEPHSNLRLVDEWADDADPARRASGRPAKWAVVDATGSKKGWTESRGEAVRLMSRLALRQKSVLPLKVIDDSGQPTGDRLA